MIIGILMLGISSSFGTFISIISKSDMKANIVASSAAIFFSLLGGTFVPYEQMPGIIKGISIFSPVRWLLTITRSMEQGIQIGNHGESYIILAGFIVFFYFSSLASLCRKTNC